MNKNEIFVIYGDQPKEMVLTLLNEMKPEEGLPKESRIGIKPNLVVAKPAASGATTTPELVEGIVEYFQSKGYQNLCIMEGSWVGDRTSRAFKVCGYEAISKKYGIPLIDLQRDGYCERMVDGIKLNICKKMLEIDHLINVPVLKGHCQTNLTCALKNMKGCIPDSEKRRFHTLGLHKPIAHLNKAIRQNLIIVDGLNGDLSFEEGGNPVQMNRIFAGFDPVMIDSYAAHLLGFDLDEIPYIKLAEDLGVGTTKWQEGSIRELNSGRETQIRGRTGKAKFFTQYIEEREACSACYGSLIHALERLRERGELQKVKSRLYIGQYYKNKSMEDGIGVGQCAKGCPRHIPGCPPSAGNIVKFFEEN